MIVKTAKVPGASVGLRNQRAPCGVLHRIDWCWRAGGMFGWINRRQVWTALSMYGAQGAR